MKGARLENLPLFMIREHLDHIPQHSMPPNYFIRRYGAGDEKHWLAINAAADNYNVFTIEKFQREFSGDEAALKQRCFFLCAGSGRAIGTATAWYNDDYRGAALGRLHWVAILPEFQGRHLAKPMLTVVMNRLAELHDAAYLSTRTVRLIAIGIYLDFGFVPDIGDERELAAWQLVAANLDHAVLRERKLWHDRRCCL